MNFLEFAIWGAWFVVLGNYLAGLKFSRQDIGRIYATMSLGSIISPMFVGAIADRYFSAQILMGILHLIGAGLLYYLAQIKTPRLFFWVALLYALCYGPTLALSNAVIFTTVPQTLDFPSIRVLGTIGWIAANLALRLFIRKDQQVNNSPLLLAAALSVVLGAYSFFLPDSPPRASGSGAEVTPVMGVSLEVEKGGSGYKEAPRVVVTGGGGSGVEAKLEVKEGKVTEVELQSAGSGYTSVPEVKLEGGGGSGVVLKARLSVVGGKVVTGGTGYKARKIISVVPDESDLKAEGLKPAVLTANLGDDGAVTGVEIVVKGAGYTKPPQFAFPEPGIPFIKALELLAEPSKAVFFAVCFLITIALAFYYSFTALFLEKGIRVKPENVAPLMTIGQWVEIVFMLTLSFFLQKFGMKAILIAGMAAWGIRYAIFSAQLPLPLIIVGIGLHGICFDFFFAAGMIHTADMAPTIAASAQSLFGVLTYGLGMYLGTEASGLLNQRLTREISGPDGRVEHVTDWRTFWLVPCIGVLLCLAVFVIFFRPSI